jgi:PAS domain S-box-containing protein
MVSDINKYKKTEKSLRESRDNLSRILDNSPAVIFSKDLDGKYTIINKKFEEISGLTKDKVIHRTDFELFPEEFATQSVKNDQQVIQNLAPLEIEEIAPVNGKLKTFLSAKYPLINLTGQLYGISGFSIDIEKRKQTEDALKQSEEKYRSLVEQSLDMLFLHDLEGNFLDVNKAAVEQTGFSEKELLRLKVFDLLHENYDRDEILDIWKSWEPGQHITLEAEHLKKNGEVYPVEVTTGKISIGNIEYILALVRDITQRKNTERALENAKNQWEVTFDAITDWVVIIDKDFNIIRSNKASETYFKLSPQDIVGKKCYEIVHGTDSPPFECPRKRAIQLKQREDFECQTENGRWWHFFVDPIKSINKEDGLTVHVVRDITDSKIRDKKIISAMKAEAFRIWAGGLAHDYNNLLTIIWGNISLLKNEISGTVAREFFKETENACELARSLTQNFITLSMSKGAALNKFECDIKKVLNTAVELSAKTKDVSVSFDYPADLPMLELDMEQMLIVFQNIVVNAIEAMPAGGSLNIRIEIVSADHDKDVNFIEISLEDTGTGIPESDLPKVFDPYFTTKPMSSQKGVGLGLASAQAVVARHGGSIHINSVVGKGTTVIVSLPA